jgi:hypothetical protein
MAIAASKLHRSIRARQVGFQMYAVIELYCAGINAPGAHSGKFRVARIESVNVSRVTGGCSGCVKICVALRATRVTRSRQSQASAMLAMASGTVRSKYLVRVVNRAVVASFASTVARFGAENPSLFHVTGAAAFAQHSVARRHLPAAVNPVVARNRKPPKPNQRKYWHGQRQNKPQSPERMRALEVIQVDALRKLLRSQLRSPHNPSLLNLIT